VGRSYFIISPIHPEPSFKPGRWPLSLYSRQHGNEGESEENRRGPPPFATANGKHFAGTISPYESFGARSAGNVRCGHLSMVRAERSLGVFERHALAALLADKRQHPREARKQMSRVSWSSQCAARTRTRYTSDQPHRRAQRGRTARSIPDRRNWRLKITAAPCRQNVRQCFPAVPAIDDDYGFRVVRKVRSQFRRPAPPRRSAWVTRVGSMVDRSRGTVMR
jgi:hypothetical protein